MFIVLYMCPTTSPGLVPKVGQVLTTYSVPLLGQVVDPITSSFIELVYRTIYHIAIRNSLVIYFILVVDGSGRDRVRF
ncbi:hypothetical protein [Myroides odoratimimus]|uniref:hypothetical protein n=1 Tax=Myroides odoratimimus TaxID=76832 RepID=UPI002577ECDD|nr:hypothetical protein [Myroides odoratimimus]MDM1326201.1 hypothetical protein [Myroides odoratimimus]